MNKNGFKTREDEQEWRMTQYRAVVVDQAVRQRALLMAYEMRAADDPPVVLADLETARAYIRKVLMTADIQEISGMMDVQLAAIWARGTLGAARYRASGAPRRGGRMR